MPSAFPGFPPEAMQFFRGLARNNNRDWFLPRKDIFEAKVKQPMRELVALVNAGMKSYAPDHVTEPDKAIYRFYRDTRFSKDKTPYKDRIAATFPRRGLSRHEGAGYYFSVSHKEVAVGGGAYMPLPDTLRAIRTSSANCWRTALPANSTERFTASNYRACPKVFRPIILPPICSATSSSSTMWSCRPTLRKRPNSPPPSPDICARSPHLSTS